MSRGTQAAVSPETTALVEALRRKLELEPSQPGLHVELGKAYEELSQDQLALVEHQKALSLDANCIEASFRSGELFLKAGALDRAETSFLKALEIDAKMIPARAGLFRVYCAQGDFDRALPLGEEIRESEIQDSSFHELLRDVYLRKGMDDQAFAELQVIVQLVADDVPHMKELAEAFAVRGQNEKALEILQRVLTLAPEDPSVRLKLIRAAYSRRAYLELVELARPTVEEWCVPSDIAAIAGYYLSLGHCKAGDVAQSRSVLSSIPSVNSSRLDSEDRQAAGELCYSLSQESNKEGDLRAGIELLSRALGFSPENHVYQEALQTFKRDRSLTRNRARRRVLSTAAIAVGVVGVLIAAWIAVSNRLATRGQVSFTLQLADTVQVASNQISVLLSKDIDVVRERLIRFGIRKPLIKPAGDQISVVLPRMTAIAAVENLISRTGLLEFRMLADGAYTEGVIGRIDDFLRAAQGEGPNAANARSFRTCIGTDRGDLVVDEQYYPTVTKILIQVDKAKIVGEYRFFFGPKERAKGRDMRKLYLLKRDPELSTADGKLIDEAHARIYQGSDNPQTTNTFIVVFTLSRTTNAKYNPYNPVVKFATITGRYIGKRMAIVVDSIVQSAPVIQSRIPDGSGMITTGDVSGEKARDLAIVLASGMLPSCLKIVAVDQ